MPVLALSSQSVNLPVGGLWSLLVFVADEDGIAVDEVPTFTVTLPGGGTASPVPRSVTAGVYAADYIIAAPGRHVATVTEADRGALGFTAWASAVVPASGMPDVDDVKAYLGDNSYDDADIGDALDAEAAAQRAYVKVPAAYPPDLRQALLRRTQRNLYMRSLPVGLPQGDSESGPQVIPGYDPEVRRLERPWRRRPVG